MRRRVGLPAASALMLLILISWYARPIVSAHHIGIPWNATLRHAHCTSAPGDEYCTTAWPITLRPPTYGVSMRLQPLTRELLRADRTWNLTDSASWARVSDSVQRGLARHHWDRLPCDSAATHFPIAEAWRVGEHEIRFYASPRIPERGTAVRRFANVQLVAFGAFGCGPRYDVRLMTPAEVARATRDWLSRQMGFQ
jgi:hypothetical protein